MATPIRRLLYLTEEKQINIMKYIGATDRFIRIPFYYRGNNDKVFLAL